MDVPGAFQARVDDRIEVLAGSRTVKTRRTLATKADNLLVEREDTQQRPFERLDCKDVTREARSSAASNSPPLGLRLLACEESGWVERKGRQFHRARESFKRRSAFPWEIISRADGLIGAVLSKSLPDAFGL